MHCLLPSIDLLAVVIQIGLTLVNEEVVGLCCCFKGFRKSREFEPLVRPEKWDVTSHTCECPKK